MEYRRKYKENLRHSITFKSDQSCIYYNNKVGVEKQKGNGKLSIKAFSSNKQSNNNY